MAIKAKSSDNQPEQEPQPEAKAPIVSTAITVEPQLYKECYLTILGSLAPAMLTASPSQIERIKKHTSSLAYIFAHELGENIKG